MTETPNVPQVDVHALADDAVVLDVREHDEYEAGHAPGAIHTPLADLPISLGQIPDTDVVHVVCRSGGRSARAVEWLRREGYEAVNVDGGMRAWAAAGKKLVASSADEPQVI